MLSGDSSKNRFWARGTFDEANYFVGNNFQIGGSDRQGFRPEVMLENSLRLKKGLGTTDDKIKSEAHKSIVNQNVFDLKSVEIAVKNGVIKLIGSVRDRRLKRELEKSFEHIPGVIEVINDLKISLF